MDFLKITVRPSDSMIIRDTRILSEEGTGKKKKKEPFYEAINNVLMKCAKGLVGTVN